MAQGAAPPCSGLTGTKRISCSDSSEKVTFVFMSPAPGKTVQQQLPRRIIYPTIGQTRQTVDPQPSNLTDGMALLLRWQRSFVGCYRSPGLAEDRHRAARPNTRILATIHLACEVRRSLRKSRKPVIITTVRKTERNIGPEIQQSGLTGCLAGGIIQKSVE